MHRHDFDLIAALADGSLEDESQARRRIENCSDCRAEFEAHKSVLAALASVEAAAMTDHEKAALHRDVWTQLRTGAPAARPATPWWYRWSYAAAGLFVIVGLVGVLTQMGGSGDDSAGETFAEVSSGLDDAAAESDGAVSDLQSEETTMAAAERAAEEAAPAEDATAGAPEALGLLETLKGLRTSPQAYHATADETAHQECLTEAGLEDHIVVRLIPHEDQVYIEAVPEGEAEDSEDVTFVDAATCEVVTADE